MDRQLKWKLRLRADLTIEKENKIGAEIEKCVSSLKKDRRKW